MQPKARSKHLEALQNPSTGPPLAGTRHHFLEQGREGGQCATAQIIAVAESTPARPQPPIRLRIPLFCHRKRVVEFPGILRRRHCTSLGRMFLEPGKTANTNGHSGAPRLGGLPVQGPVLDTGLAKQPFRSSSSKLGSGARLASIASMLRSALLPIRGRPTPSTPSLAAASAVAFAGWIENRGPQADQKRGLKRGTWQLRRFGLNPCIARSCSSLALIRLKLWKAGMACDAGEIRGMAFNVRLRSGASSQALGLAHRIGALWPCFCSRSLAESTTASSLRGCRTDQGPWQGLC